MPLTQGVAGTADLIIQPKQFITTVGLILTIDQCAEMIAVLDLNGGIHTADESVGRIFRDCEQSRFILGLSALHHRVIQIEHVAS